MSYIWKEWLELSRGKAFWLFFLLVVAASLSVLMSAKSLPAEHGLTIFLQMMFDMNAYIVSLLCLFFASFSVMQEKEQRTMVMIVAKSGSPWQFLWKKSAAIQLITMMMFVVWYFVLIIPAKFWFVFHLSYFLYFLLATVVLVFIFNQIGIGLGFACKTKIQLIGANLFAAFFFIYLYDFVLLYILPSVTYDNVHVFSLVYFLQPLHALRFYLETSLGMFSLDYLSRTMKKFFSFPPGALVALNMFVWGLGALVASMVWSRKGEER
ncbi:copper ABC transporter permease [Geobacillus thermodenitrificans]|uniref:Copper ABC transporter (Permease) n=1 Tax=Geobacillus thermodenitrificans (strain NG80-2) TaxID=420246 RepID=A4IP41_GEOTN|nr:copper ABC transporter permease [Geobacillus thermodenitrificans]ABO67095.1 Copper ABC transporter (permease) [Geobacillus thermodenitrificans NG80-2]